MPIELRLPALSATMETATLAKWLVRVGEDVRAGDPVAEIETDKATMEVEADANGRITTLLVAEGAQGVAVGALLALLDPASTSGVTPDSREVLGAGVLDDVSQAYTPGPALAELDAGSPASATPAPDDRACASGALDMTANASPLARRLAAQAGIILKSVRGTGPDGRIQKADLDAVAGPALRRRPSDSIREGSAPRSVAVLAEPPAPGHVVPVEAVRLSTMRKTIARRLTLSKQQAPHIYLTVEVRLDALLALRADLNAVLHARDLKLSVNDLLIKAQALALREVPGCNVQYEEDQLLKFKRADIAVAVSVPGGVVTPIIRGADAKTVGTIATEMKDLASRARDGGLSPEDYQGGTASLSNLGMFGIKQFAAVINPPQGMILAVGAAERRALVCDEQLVVASVMSATGSFDHRAIDGAEAAAFMTAFRDLVENPYRIVA